MSLMILLGNRTMLFSTYIKEYSFLMLWVVTISLLIYLTMSYATISGVNSLNLLLSTVLVYLIFLAINSNIINHSILIKIYTAMAYFTLVYLALQILLFAFFKFPLSGKLPFLDLISVGYEGQFNYLAEFGGRYSFVWYSSIFAEPSHLALFCIPVLCIKLFDEETKNIFIAIIITVMIFLSASGNGIVITSVIWLFYFYSRTKKISVRRVGNLIVGIALLYNVHLILNNFTFYSSVVGRLFTSNTSVAKADYRIYRGFDYWWQLPIMRKIFGIGYRNLLGFAKYYNLSSQFDSRSALNFEYMNAIAQILIYFGFVGFIPFVIFIRKLFKNNSLMVKSLVIAFGLMCVSSSVLFDTFWLLYLSLIFSFIFREDKKRAVADHE